MNREQAIQNAIAHGVYRADRVAAFAKEKARSNEPSIKQVKYRDDLYRFVLEKGAAREGFKLGRTQRDIHRDIRAFLTIINKHGLAAEWNSRADINGFGGNK